MQELLDQAHDCLVRMAIIVYRCINTRINALVCFFFSTYNAVHPQMPPNPPKQILVSAHAGVTGPSLQSPGKDGPLKTSLVQQATT